MVVVPTPWTKSKTPAVADLPLLPNAAQCTPQHTPHTNQNHAVHCAASNPSPLERNALAGSPTCRLVVSLVSTFSWRPGTCF